MTTELETAIEQPETLTDEATQDLEAQSDQDTTSETDTEKTEQEADNAPEEKPAGVAKPAAPTWPQKRINELTKQRRMAEEEVVRLKAEVAARNTEESPNPIAGATFTQAEIDRRIAEGVASQTQQKRFNDACDTIFAAGAKEFSGTDGSLSFKDALGQLGMVGDIPPYFIEAATALDETGHKVLYHLGNNLDLTTELLTLPPVKLAIRMAALSAELNKPISKPVSRAAPPIKPLSGNGRADVDLSRASLDDFMEARNRVAPIKR